MGMASAEAGGVTGLRPCRHATLPSQFYALRTIQMGRKAMIPFEDCSGT